jgi:hypothetical protein
MVVYPYFILLLFDRCGDLVWFGIDLPAHGLPQRRTGTVLACQQFFSGDLIRKIFFIPRAHVFMLRAADLFCIAGGPLT